MNISSQITTNVTSQTSNFFDTIKEPNWEVIPHFGMPRPSQGELIQQIKDLVLKESKAKTREEFDAISKERSELRAQYISVVSPDRKSLYASAKKAIIKYEKESKKPKNLVDYLLEGSMKNGVPFSIGGNGTVTAGAATLGGNQYEINYGGERVLSINPNIKPPLPHVNWSPTTAENKKIDEFCRIYKNARNMVERENQRSNSNDTKINNLETPLVSEMNSMHKESFDYKA